jgi:hypothetical protein
VADALVDGAPVGDGVPLAGDGSGAAVLPGASWSPSSVVPEPSPSVPPAGAGAGSDVLDPVPVDPLASSAAGSPLPRTTSTIRAS